MAGVHERLQDRRVLSRRLGIELVQRCEGLELVGLVPAAFRAALLVGTDEVELLTGQRRAGGEPILPRCNSRWPSRSACAKPSPSASIAPGLRAAPP